MNSTNITDEDMQKIYKIIGSNVKHIRKSKNISQLKLALAIGHKAVGTISMAELCINNKHFNIEHLIKIADVLGVKVTDFFEGL
jgi:transcriptional regulator with XRE-family HTH domain